MTYNPSYRNSQEDARRSFLQLRRLMLPQEPVNRAEASGETTVHDLQQIYNALTPPQNTDVVHMTAPHPSFESLFHEDVPVGGHVRSMDLVEDLDEDSRWLHRVPNDVVRDTLQELSNNIFECAVCGVVTNELASLGRWECRMDIDFPLGHFIYRRSGTPSDRVVRYAVRADHRPPNVASWRSERASKVVVLPIETMTVWPKFTQPREEALRRSSNTWIARGGGSVVTSGNVAIERYDGATATFVQNALVRPQSEKQCARYLERTLTVVPLYDADRRIFYKPSEE